MAARTVSPPLAQLPNALTLFRLALIPPFVAAILVSSEGRTWYAGTIFLIAGITDQVDGFLARRWNVESAFGKIADPLADRLMIGVAIVLEWHAGRLPWVALAIPLRDLGMLAATPLMIRSGYRFEVNTLGKAATWLLYLGVGCSMVTHPSTAWPLWIFWAGLALALVSLALYARKARRELIA
ncbi:MAG: CDP-alcohol phosphatidyltransferase family protein [Gaiellaceae bacterium]